MPKRDIPEPALCLTPQPFRPKLHLSHYMLGNMSRIRILTLLLGVLFLAAQFHYCADVTSGPSSSHVCPLCSTVGSAVATPPTSLAIVRVVTRLEIPAVTAAVSLSLPRFTSTRAPPAL